MATSTTVTTKKPNFFSNIGHFFAKIFGNPVAVRIEASIADIVLPGFSGLINSAATALINAETAAAAANMQNGTGTQKMAYAVSLFQSTYNGWAAQNGLPQEPVAVQNLLQQVFNLLQELTPIAAVAPVTAAATLSPVAAVAQTQGTLL